MIAHEELEKYAHLVEDEDEHGAFEEWAPRKGLDLQLAVAVCSAPITTWVDVEHPTGFGSASKRP